MRLSILDQSPVPAGSTASAALAHTLDLARRTDRLGYHRYWLSEHHGGGGVAGSSPEILAAAVAMATERMRVGSGGVLLSHYSPYKVAESFRLLEALFPGRIDLGIGRGAGAGDPAIVAALRAASHREPFALSLRALVDYLNGDGSPEIWLLGSSEASALQAAALGLPFCFAHFIAPTRVEAIVTYRARFQPSRHLAEPRVGIAVTALCAANGEEAERLASSFVLWRLGLEHGHAGEIPTVSQALQYRYSSTERARIAALREELFVGEAGAVAQRLGRLASAHGVDELVVLTVCHDHEARVRSYELLARHTIAADRLTPVGSE